MLTTGDELNGTYTVLGRLGQGGMASVYLVEHRRLKKQFALKVLEDAISTDPSNIARFRQEAEILTKLTHQNIVRIQDWDTTAQGLPYLVMDLLVGQDLAALLRTWPALPLPVALAILKQVGAALSCAHAHGIVHRDLKPSNIFLCARDSSTPYDFDVKVLDFGIAKVVCQQGSAVRTLTHTIVGTPEYMSPEQARGLTGSLTPQSDQFSLATILYEMLAGHSAFGRRDEPVLDTLNRVAECTLWPLLAELPEALRAPLARAWNVQPDGRFPSVAAFVEAFEQHVAALQAPARDAPAAASPAPLRLRPGLRSSGLSIGILCVLAGAWAAARNRQAELQAASSGGRQVAELAGSRRAAAPASLLPPLDVEPALRAAPGGPGKQDLPRATQAARASQLPAAAPGRPPEAPQPRAAGMARELRVPAETARQEARARRPVPVVKDGSPEQKRRIHDCATEKLEGTLASLVGNTIRLRGAAVLQEVTTKIPLRYLSPFHDCLSESRPPEGWPEEVRIHVRWEAP